jgi:hypothetical protein
MKTFQVSGRNEITEVPSEWEELSAGQVDQLLRMALTSKEENLDFDGFIVRSFYIVANIKRDMLSVIREKLLPALTRREKFINTYLLAKPYTDFMFKAVENPETKEVTRVFKYDTVVNFLPSFEIFGIKYFGPDTLITDLSFGEFRFALEEMNEYFRTKEIESLNRMIAVLYRPHDPKIPQHKNQGREREPLNMFLIDKYAKKINRLPNYKKLMILSWFTNCINAIKEADLTISGREICFEPLFPKPDPDAKPSAGIGWTGILYSISKEGLFGDTEKTDATNLFSVLLYMYDNHLQNMNSKPQSK